MNLQVDVERIVLAHKAVRAELLADCIKRTHWAGQLASSPLATAAAISALVASHRANADDTLRENVVGEGQLVEQLVQGDLSELLCESVQWLARHQNPDGGWGDCVGGQSTLAATMLVQAAFRMTGVPAKYADLIETADQYIAAQGGAAGLRRDGAMNKSVVAAVLTHCALAGIVPWRNVRTLPFEVACLPKQWRQRLQLPYPRYAMPLLIAVGRAKFFHDPPRNPLTRLLRRSLQAKSLAVLESLQADDDSFLGSTLYTSFVVTSLASIGCQDHAIVRRGIEFLLSAVRGDASWAVETDYAIANTALALEALISPSQITSTAATSGRPSGNNIESAALSTNTWDDTAHPGETVADTEGFNPTNRNGQLEHFDEAVPATSASCVQWLLENQRRERDMLTEMPPGGWATSQTSGALPNAVATAQSLLALLRTRGEGSAARDRLDEAVHRGVEWLLELQEEDGGWATFYRAAVESQLEQSCVDATASALRALAAWQQSDGPAKYAGSESRLANAVERGWNYLLHQQGEDGRLVPRWFGNEYQLDDLNPVYGTAQVLIMCGELNRLDSQLAAGAARWLESVQHATGGWGPPRARRDYSGAENDGFRAWRGNEAMAKHCSVEETALAITALLPLAPLNSGAGEAVSAGLTWLAAAVEQDEHRRPAVIGYYLSKIWYHERLYPLVYTAGAFSLALRQLAPHSHEVAPVGSR
jgi:squalene-hopene/tetraprenyl-beta-curcumene cyclase